MFVLKIDSYWHAIENRCLGFLFHSMIYWKGLRAIALNPSIKNILNVICLFATKMYSQRFFSHGQTFSITAQKRLVNRLRIFCIDFHVQIRLKVTTKILRWKMTDERHCIEYVLANEYDLNAMKHRTQCAFRRWWWNEC